MKAGETELHAYVDGALDAETRRAVEAQLAANPEDAARVAEYVAQRDALHARYDAVLDEPIPETLRLAARSRSQPRYALAAGWAAIGIVIGWLAAQVVPGVQLGPLSLTTSGPVRKRPPVLVGTVSKHWLLGMRMALGTAERTSRAMRRSAVSAWSTRSARVRVAR